MLSKIDFGRTSHWWPNRSVPLSGRGRIAGWLFDDSAAEKQRALDLLKAIIVEQPAENE